MKSSGPGRLLHVACALRAAAVVALVPWRQQAVPTQSPQVPAGQEPDIKQQ